MQQLVTQVLLPLVLATIMLGMGLGLRLADFKRVFIQPKAALLGLVLQLVFLPLLALLIILLLPLTPVAAAGLFLVALCPGGATSNLFSFIVRGDVALSVTLTGLSSILSWLTLPLLFLAYLSLAQGGATHFTLPLAPAVKQLALVTLLPITCGMLLRQRFPLFASRVQSWFRRLATIVMLLIILALLAVNPGVRHEFFSISVLAIILLSSLAMATAFILAAKVGLSWQVQRTLAIEVGVQNAGAAMLVALSIMQQPALATVPLLYGIVMNLPALGLVYCCLYRSNKQELAR